MKEENEANSKLPNSRPIYNAFDWYFTNLPTKL